MELFYLADVFAIAMTLWMFHRYMYGWKAYSASLGTTVFRGGVSF